MTFTATVSSGGVPVGAGLVKFCDMQSTAYCEDGALLGTVWMTKSGTATLRIPMSFGSHRVQALFQGTGSYTASSSALQVVDVSSGTVASVTTIVSSQAYGYGGLYQVQAKIAGAPIPAFSGSLSFLDTSNASYNLKSVPVGTSVMSFTALTSVGGTAIQQPQFTAVGDLNRDGKLDFAVASNLGNAVQVFLGNGNGTFSLTSTLAANGPNALILADINGDGILDIAVLNVDTLGIYLGNGDGTFTLKGAPSTGDWGYGFAIGDFNGDGIPDFAITENYINSVQLMLGNGDGTFRMGLAYTTGNNPEDIVTEDFNRDGLPDLAFVNQMDNTAAILLGNGSGGFASGPTISLPASPYTLVAGDFNGDGIPDLAISALIQGGEIFLGAGDGTFTQVSTVSCGSSANGYGMAIADFNNDGKTDLVVGGTLFLGDGAGKFSVLNYVGGNGSRVSVGDFNGDGSPDLITPVYPNTYPYNGNVKISLEQATATISVAPLAVLGPGSHNVVASYSGDALHAPSQSTAATMTGAPISTTLALSVFPGTSVAIGDTVQFTAAITPQSVGNYIPGGTVTFKDGSTVLGTSTVSAATASFSTNTLATGSHSITAAYVGDTNFAAASSAAKVLTVGGKITPVITWATPAPITYGTPLSGTQLNATSGSVPGTFIYTPALGAVLAAGTRTLSVTFNPTDAATYNSATQTVQLIVNKASLAVTANDASVTYGNVLPGFTAAYSGFVNGDTAAVLSGSPSLTTSATSGSPAGSYTITAAQGTLSAANYAFTYANGTLTITRAILSVAANNTNRTYGATNPTFTASYSGFVNGDTAAVLSGSPSLTTSAATSSPVGSYTITAAAGTLAAANYSFTFASGILSIDRAPLTVTASNATMTYGAALPGFTAAYSGFVNGENASVLTGAPSLTTAATSASPAGNYTITAAQGTLAAANYSFAFVNGLLTINKASLTVTAVNATRSYGTTNPPFTATFSGFLNGDTTASLSGAPSLTTTATASSPAGTYTITAAAGTLTAANYSFSFVDGTLTINKASLTVTANGATRIYGAANPAFSPTYTGFVNGDTASVLTGTPSLTTTATSTSDVGTYTITVSVGTLSATNYSFSFVNGTLSVNQAPLTITANNQSKTYGQTLVLGTTAFTATGLQNGETIGAVILTSAGTASGASVSGSPYPIVPSAASGGTFEVANYTISYVNGSLAVVRATPTVTAWPVPSTITYGQTLASSALTGGSASVPGSFTFTNPSTLPNGGTSAQSVTFSPTDAVDFNNVVGSVNVTVTPRSTTVAINSENPDPSKAGTAFTITYTVSSTYGVPAGNVKVVLSDANGTSCVGSLSPTGTGSCPMTPPANTPNGFYNLTATYVGSSNYSSSVSPSVRHHVN